MSESPGSPSAGRSSSAESGGSGGSAAANAGGGGTSHNGGTSGGTRAGGGGSAGATLNGGTAGAATGGVSNAGSGAGASGGIAGASVATAGSGAGGSGDMASAGTSSVEAAGAAGTPELACQGSADACGCGCCGGVALTPTCYYPEHGDDLAALVAADKATGVNCDAVGCSIGAHLVCCETPSVDDTATYTMGGYESSYNYLVVSRKTAAGRCTQAVFVEAPDTQPVFLLDISDGAALVNNSTQDGACDDMNGAPQRAAIGGIGSMSHTAPHSCSWDFDFTLFFGNDDGSVDPVRFKATKVALPGLTDGQC